MSGLLLGEWITPIHLRPCKGLIRKYKNAKMRKCENGLRLGAIFFRGLRESKFLH